MATLIQRNFFPPVLRVFFISNVFEKKMKKKILTCKKAVHIYVSPSIDTLRKYKEKDTNFNEKNNLSSNFANTSRNIREEIFGKSSSPREARCLNAQVAKCSSRNA